MHQVDAGNMQGARPGPRVGNVYACRPCARQIAAMPGSWPWLAAVAEGVPTQGAAPELSGPTRGFVLPPENEGD
ncbi:hypothetical protein [Streptomyces abyssalis]|uniref:hypothetical protein n=1 Tax=Streptomyces abyssalis TaxID=933944 RepID=UPI001112D662|nr:hypothetical protein [Streptomyces abyssalis]